MKLYILYVSYIKLNTQSNLMHAVFLYIYVYGSITLQMFLFWSLCNCYIHYIIHKRSLLLYRQYHSIETKFLNVYLQKSSYTQNILILSKRYVIKVSRLWRMIYNSIYIKYAGMRITIYAFTCQNYYDSFTDNHL